MTLQEFKAWFEGFSENLDGPPDEKKWDRIKAKIAEIDGAFTPYPVFVEKYLPYRYYDYTWCSRYFPMNSVDTGSVSMSDWREAGRADAQSLGAASAA